MFASRLAKLRLYPQPLLREIVRRRLTGGVLALRARFFPRRLTDRDFLAGLGFDSVDSALAALHERLDRHFFLPPRDRLARLAALHSACPWTVAITQELAERILQHNWKILGTPVQVSGACLNWHTDFARGVCFPRRFRTEMTQVRSSRPADYRIPWELSRFHHLAILGKAYWLAGYERYAREFCAQLEDWWGANPYEYGINWTCAMEAAFRAVNWLWSYSFFRDSPSLDSAFRLKFFKSLFQHAQFIGSNLEYSVWDHKVTTNHLLSDLLGLLHLSLLFPVHAGPRKSFQDILRQLARELEIQVFADGVSFEASTTYHRLSTELFLTALCLSRRNNIEIPEAALRRIEGMVEFIFDYIKPSGRAPLIGDGDGGRLLKFCLPHAATSLPVDDVERAETDHRGLLSLGAVLFRKPAWARKADVCGEEVVWLLGPEGTECFRALRSQHPDAPARSRARSDSGFYLMRHQDCHLLIRAGPNGQAGLGGHAHNDVFSFELALSDVDFLVDPGIYTYAGDPALRNLFRSTAYHNTVRIDGQEINRLFPELLFYLPSDARPKLLDWQSSEDFDYFAGEHMGYSRLPTPVTHRRKILFDKRGGLWVIKDEILGGGEHTIEHFFHPAPELQSSVDPVRKTICLNSAGGKRLEIHSLQDMAGGLEEQPGWISPTYGMLGPTRYFCYRTKVRLPVTLLFGLFLTDECLKTETAAAKAQAAVEAFAERAGPIFLGERGHEQSL